MAPAANKASTSPDDAIVIAVMGATGTGKSTFINLASGADLDVGDGLRSCTAEVGYSHMFELDGRKVVLIDTPGFDDTTKSDTDILKMISLHLSQTYQIGVVLSGVIYMHRITDFRVGGVNRRNFVMFRKLCGEETLRNVLIVTNMWGLLTDPTIGEKREHELRTDNILFKPVLDKGARMVRHSGMLESAQTIVREIMRNHPRPLKIQQELVDEGKDISETGAGEELSRELAALMKKHKEEMAALKEQMDEALRSKDEETRKELEEVKAEMMMSLRQAEADRERLSREYAQDKARADEQLGYLKAQFERESEERQKRDTEFGNLQNMFRESQQSAAKEREMMLGRINELGKQSRGCVIQ